MNIKFDPNNVVIKLCMSGMSLEDDGNIEDAIMMFHKAWHEATLLNWLMPALIVLKQKVLMREI